jgi:hypothetical protein
VQLSQKKTSATLDVGWQRSTVRVMLDWRKYRLVFVVVVICCCCGQGLRVVGSRALNSKNSA